MAVNKVIYGGKTLMDLTGDSVTPETLAEGVTAHDASGTQITGRMVPGGGSSVQSDWNQNDSSAADFIKNKPFYKKVENAVFLSYSQLGYDAESSSFFGVLSAHLTAGATYSVNYNGTIYLCQSYDLMGMGVALGNGLTFGMDDTGEPFVIVAIDYGENIALMVLDGATEVFLGISGELATIKRIDAEFAPYIEFYIGIDDDYLYKDASLTEKAYYGDVNEALNMRVPLYVCKDRAPEPAAIFSRTLGVDSDGNGYFYICIKMPSGGTNNTVTYKEYYTAEYTPPTT